MLKLFYFINFLKLYELKSKTIEKYSIFSNTDISIFSMVSENINRYDSKTTFNKKIKYILFFKLNF